MRFEDLDVWKRAARLSANIYKELVSLKDFGIDIDYIPEETGKQWIKETREISAMLVGLVKSKGKSV